MRELLGHFRHAGYATTGSSTGDRGIAARQSRSGIPPMPFPLARRRATSGPFDGRSVSEVRQGGEGIKNIGMFNSQRCFPSTERNYIVSSDPSEGDRKSVDFVEVPTLDAVNVRIEGQALFRLNTDPATLSTFYRKFGVRTFDGLHPYQGDDGWRSFLAIQFRPVLDNALRERSASTAACSSTTPAMLALLAALVWGIVAFLRWAGHERRVRHAHWRVRVETHADSADVLLVCEG
ncbi:MAG: hypothetical protein ACR2ML_05170, partial [Solirubrobacteraceae bacterium]